MDKSSSIKKLRRAKKLSLIRQREIRETKKTRVLSKSDIPTILHIMAPNWSHDDIEGDLYRHFDTHNISLGIEYQGSLRGILLITLMPNMIASITALHSESYIYTKMLYRLFKKFESQLGEYRFAYISKNEIFANHTIEDGGIKWVVL
jgi:hypothetical protein